MLDRLPTNVYSSIKASYYKERNTGNLIYRVIRELKETNLISVHYIVENMIRNITLKVVIDMLNLLVEKKYIKVKKIKGSLNYEIICLK